ncbi:hypothetical protein D3C72_924720 [compost metagenome]
MQLLAGLLLIHGHQGVGDLQLGGVEVDVVVGVQLAIAGDRLQRQGVGQVPRHAQGRTPGLQPRLVGQTRRGARLEVVLRRRRRHRIGHAIAQIGQAVGRLTHRHAGVVLRIVDVQVDAEGRGRVPGQAGAGGRGVLVVVFRAGGRVRDIAAAFRMQGRQAQGQGVGDRAGNRALELHQVIVAIGRRGAGAEFLARTTRHQLHGAADGVLAVEGALRTAQDFHAFQVQQVELAAADTAVIDVVDIDADRRVEGLQRVRLAHAADVDVGRVGRAAALDQVQVRHRALQVRDLLRARTLQRLAAEGRQGQRGLLRRLLGAAGGDDDVFDAGCRLRVLRPALGVRILRIGGRGDRAHGGARQQGGLHESVHLDPNLCFQPNRRFYSAFNDFPGTCRSFADLSNGHAESRRKSAAPVAPLHCRSNHAPSWMHRSRPGDSCRSEYLGSQTIASEPISL